MISQTEDSAQELPGNPSTPESINGGLINPAAVAALIELNPSAHRCSLTLYCLGAVNYLWHLPRISSKGCHQPSGMGMVHKGKTGTIPPMQVILPTVQSHVSKRQKMKVNSEGNSGAREVSAGQAARQQVPACFLPSQHHNER